MFISYFDFIPFDSWIKNLKNYQIQQKVVCPLLTLLIIDLIIAERYFFFYYEFRVLLLHPKWFLIDIFIDIAINCCCPAHSRSVLFGIEQRNKHK